MVLLYFSSLNKFILKINVIKSSSAFSPHPLPPLLPWTLSVLDIRLSLIFCLWGPPILKSHCSLSAILSVSYGSKCLCGSSLPLLPVSMAEPSGLWLGRINLIRQAWALSGKFTQWTGAACPGPSTFPQGHTLFRCCLFEGL